MLKTLNNKGLDELSIHILNELSSHARITCSEIGRRVGLSAPAVADRIQKMEEQGFIKGYRALIDLDKMGLTIQAFITFKAVSIKHDEIVRIAETLPGIMEWHSITGNASMILKVAVRSSKELEAIIEHLQEVGETSTSLILSGCSDLKMMGNVLSRRQRA